MHNKPVHHNWENRLRDGGGMLEVSPILVKKTTIECLFYKVNKGGLDAKGEGLRSRILSPEEDQEGKPQAPKRSWQS